MATPPELECFTGATCELTRWPGRASSGPGSGAIARFAVRSERAKCGCGATRPVAGGAARLARRAGAGAGHERRRPRPRPVAGALANVERRAADVAGWPGASRKRNAQPSRAHAPRLPMDSVNCRVRPSRQARPRMMLLVALGNVQRGEWTRSRLARAAERDTITVSGNGPGVDAIAAEVDGAAWFLCVNRTAPYESTVTLSPIAQGRRRGHVGNARTATLSPAGLFHRWRRRRRRLACAPLQRGRRRGRIHPSTPRACPTGRRRLTRSTGGRGRVSCGHALRELDLEPELDLDWQRGGCGRRHPERRVCGRREWRPKGGLVSSSQEVYRSNHGQV